MLAVAYSHPRKNTSDVNSSASSLLGILNEMKRLIFIT